MTHEHVCYYTAYMTHEHVCYYTATYCRGVLDCKFCNTSHIPYFIAYTSYTSYWMYYTLLYRVV